MNRSGSFGINRTEFVNRIADDVHHASECRDADRNGDRSAEIDNLHSANHSVGRKHRNRAHATFAEMLLDFRDDINRRFDIEAFARNSQSLINRR